LSFASDTARESRFLAATALPTSQNGIRAEGSDRYVLPTIRSKLGATVK